MEKRYKKKEKKKNNIFEKFMKKSYKNCGEKEPKKVVMMAFFIKLFTFVHHVTLCMAPFELAKKKCV